jgi:hypothetical protein
MRPYSAAVINDAKAFSMVFGEEADFTNVRGMGAHGRTNRIHESGGATSSPAERVIEFRYDEEWRKMGDCSDA